MTDPEKPDKRRTLKIESIGDFAYRKVKPRIRLSGHWLERAGFKPGCRAMVLVPRHGELILRSEDHPPTS